MRRTSLIVIGDVGGRRLQKRLFDDEGLVLWGGRTLQKRHRCSDVLVDYLKVGEYGMLAGSSALESSSCYVVRSSVPASWIDGMRQKIIWVDGGEDGGRILP